MKKRKDSGNDSEIVSTNLTMEDRISKTQKKAPLLNLMLKPLKKY